jgi:ribose-phosphate pyrophosphokinase
LRNRGNRILVFSGNAGRPFAKAVCENLGIVLSPLSVSRFADGEICAEYGVSLRGRDVFIIQSTGSPVNENLMELLIAIDAAKRASAKRIVAVMPYFGYARQDRKVRPRQPITAKLVAELLQTAGADCILCADIHTLAIEGFFDIPFSNICAMPLFARDMEASGNLTVVSPDVGGVVRARALAKRVSAPLVIIDKRRESPNSAEVMNIIGEVSGKDCVIIDDMIDTAGTVCKAADALKAAGAKSVKVYATHGIFSKDAKDRIAGSAIDEAVVSDSMAVVAFPKLRIISLAGMFAEAIGRIHENRSLSELSFA